MNWRNMVCLKCKILYTENNHALWRAYHLGEISKEALRDTRFKKTFRELGMPEELIPLQFEEDYVKESPHKTNLFAGAHEVLQALQPHYQMHIITNGFQESSELKLTNIPVWFRCSVGIALPVPKKFIDILFI